MNHHRLPHLLRSPAVPESSGSGAPATELDLYLDGLLSADRAAAFERAMAADPALAEQVRSQRAIDAGLRQAFAYEPRHALGRTPAPQATPQHSAAAGMSLRLADWRRQAFAVAALVVLAAGVIWMNLTPGSARRGDAIKDLPPDTAYVNLIASGFAPQFVCTTDEAFAKAVRERFGQALLVATTPSLELLGWAYDAGYRTRVLGNDSLILMAKVDGKEVIVVMDRLTTDRPLAQPTTPDIHLHRRVVGQLVVYEVSRSATPLVADKIYDPDAKK